MTDNIRLIPDGRDAFMQEVLANPDKEYLADVIILNYYEGNPCIAFSEDTFDIILGYLERNWNWVKDMIAMTSFGMISTGRLAGLKFGIRISREHPLYKELCDMVKGGI